MPDLVDPDTIRGLSPRVRGNLLDACARRRCQRSIPACAGEPQRLSASGQRLWVYPRVCGGTGRTKATLKGVGGLSPRVRGNLEFLNAFPTFLGSIPACAGEPRLRRLPALPSAVYPRVCGGTTDRPTSAYEMVGLSPRVRGNPCVHP